VAVTLTVVIGMSTAVFSVVNAVLLRPLSYPSAERLVWISTYDDNAREAIVPRFDFRVWRREATRSFERMVAYRSTDLTLATTNGAVQARVGFVSSDFWTTIDVRVLIFTLAVVSVTALAFGVLPALAAGRANAEALGRNQATPSPTVLLGRGALVGVEIALAVVLLTGSGLLLRSAVRLNEHPAGFHPESILVMKVPLSGQAYAERSARDRYISGALARIGELPGVDAVGATPNTTIRTGFFPRGSERLPPGQLRIPTTLNATSAGYARAMGLTVVSGRWITDSEAAPVVVLNEVARPPRIRRR
jgi:hypothetical protein